MLALILAEMDKRVEIPYQSLEKSTLFAMLEEFVTRDGTDYGVRECSVEEKSQQVLKQIEQGHVAIVFDSETQSCNLIARR